MSTDSDGDASFEEGGERALLLEAASAADLPVISALLQDAVGKVGNVHYAPRRRRFSLLIYRFRWEDAARADRERRAYERVAAALTIDDVLRARATGLDPMAREAVFNLLSLSFTEEADGAGALEITCSGGAALHLKVEAVNARLVDLTRPWAAGGQPQHFE